MALKTFFEHNWLFSGVGPGGDPNAYPATKTLKIQAAGLLKSKVEWTDAFGQIHIFLLDYDSVGGRLSSQPGVDIGLGIPKNWNFSITQVGAGIVGEVEDPDAGSTETDEANLAGSWGADAPPMIDDLIPSLPAFPPQAFGHPPDALGNRLDQHTR